MGREGLSWAEEARQEGAIAAQRRILRQLVERRFGAIVASDVATLEQCDAAGLERALQRILTARSFAELFAS